MSRFASSLSLLADRKWRAVLASGARSNEPVLAAHRNLGLWCAVLQDDAALFEAVAKGFEVEGSWPRARDTRHANAASTTEAANAAHIDTKLAAHPDYFVRQVVERADAVIHPLGVVRRARNAPKLAPCGELGKARIIHDLSGAGVNDTWSDVDARVAYDDAVELQRTVQHGDWVTVTDVEGAFYKLFVAPKDRHKVAFRWRGATYECTRLVMGWRLSPRAFQSIKCAIRAFLIAQPQWPGDEYFIKIFIDDSACGGPDRVTVRLACALWRHLLNALGLTVATDKGFAEPKQSFEFLGLAYDTRTMRVSVPQAKRDVLLTDIVHALRRPRSIPRSAIEGFVGRLSFVASALPSARLHMRHLWAAASDAGQRMRMPFAEPSFWRGAQRELEWWRDTLISKRCVDDWCFGAVQRGEPWPPPCAVEASSDAALELGQSSLGAFFEGKVFELPRAQRATLAGFVPKTIAHFEALAILLAIRHFDVRAVVVQWHVDNSDVFWALLKRRTKNAELASIVARLADELAERRATLMPSWIASKDNDVADGITRRAEEPEILAAALQRWRREGRVVAHAPPPCSMRWPPCAVEASTDASVECDGGSKSDFNIANDFFP